LIPAYNATNNEFLNFRKGFNRWGCSLYKSDGAEKLQVIFSLWAHFFIEGPDELDLTGSYIFEDENDKNQHYQRLILKRDILVTKFQTISNFAREVNNSKGELVVLHLGI
jgi:hypothetical protein